MSTHERTDAEHTESGRKRPAPDVVDLEETEPQTEPGRREPKIELTDLSRRDVVAIVKRTVKEALDDQVTDLAAALAYYSFLAIPAALIVVTGMFSLIGGASAIDSLMARFRTVMPGSATTLLGDSLTRMHQNQGSTLALTIVGFVLALWTTTGAMTAFMRALDRAYDTKETRGFVRQRVVALEMLACVGVALVLVFGLLVLGPHVSTWVGEAVHAEHLVAIVWWVAQWPVLLAGLLAAFATMLYLGPDVEVREWRFLTPGAALAVVVWLLASGLFAVYTSMFGSYNKTWGSLAAVIVMLTWLWLSGLALLLGAEVNAEVERSRALRAHEVAEAPFAERPLRPSDG